MQTLSFSRIRSVSVATVFIVVTSLVLTMPNNAARVNAQVVPPANNCSGQLVDPNARCARNAVCAGANPCSQWVTTFPTQMCINPNPPNPAFNCIVNLNQRKPCGTSGICSLNEDQVCSTGTGSWPITTFQTAQGGACDVPGPGIPGDPAA